MLHNAVSEFKLPTLASSPIDSVGHTYIRGCLQGAARRGYSPEALLNAADIDEQVYHANDAEIDGTEFQRLILTIHNTLNDEYLGFLDVRGSLEMSYMVGEAAVTSKTFGHAAHRMMKIVNAIRNDIHLKFENGGTDSEIGFMYGTSGFTRGVEPHFFTWLKLFWLYKFQCWLVGKKIRLNKVSFSTDRPANALDYEAVFGCPVQFNTDRAGLYYDRDYLNAPVIRTEVEYREGDFINGDINWFTIPGADQSFTRRVEQILSDLYREGATTPNLDVMGGILFCSPRTLSRKLQKEGVTFQELKDRVRRSIAEKLLASTDMSIADIAERVGYSEPADFSRAFVGWLGKTPSSYRSENRAH